MTGPISRRLYSKDQSAQFEISYSSCTDSNCRLDLDFDSNPVALLIYTSDEASDRDRSGRRSKRAASQSNRHRMRHARKNAGKRHSWRPNPPCQRRWLSIDFEMLGWNDWIVAPLKYDAYFCQGDCRLPLHAHMNATNHAIVQSIINSVNPAAAPKPTCAPTELSALSLLYLNEFDVVTLKTYSNMIVEACGCR